MNFELRVIELLFLEKEREKNLLPLAKMDNFILLAPRPKITKYESINRRTKIHNSSIIKRKL